MAHPFKVTDEFEVTATPEEVWDAIATGAGVDAWFMGVNEIEPREGGTTRMQFRGSAEEAHGDGVGAAHALREPHPGG